MRRGRGTVVSQAQLDFDILRVASNREIDRVSSERVPYRINRLDGPQIDQGRDGKAIDCSVRVVMRFQRPDQDANAFPPPVGMPGDDFAEPRYCRGNGRFRIFSIRQECGDMRDRSRPDHTKHDGKFLICRFVPLDHLRKRQQWANRRFSP